MENRKYYIVASRRNDYIFELQYDNIEHLSEIHDPNFVSIYEVTNHEDFIDGESSKFRKNTDGTVTLYIDQEMLKLQKDNNNRRKRINLLTAFDLWEKAVIRGREDDSEEIMQWYKDILDLREDAFENIPSKIKYYMGGN